MAVDRSDIVLYVGRLDLKKTTSDLQYAALKKLEGVKIIYLQTESDWLPMIESALRAWFKPPLNTDAEHPKGIAKLREAKGLHQKELAALVGVDVSTLRNWEKNKAGVDAFLRAAKLCKVLECNPEDLVAED